MANIQANKKSIKTQEKARKRNAAIKSRAKTAIKKTNLAIVNNDTNQLQIASISIKELDTAVSKGVLHKNNAARRKSRLLKKLGGKQPQKISS